jgi:hypothetical protein
MTAAAKTSPVQGRRRKPAPKGQPGLAATDCPSCPVASAIEFCVWLSRAEPGDTLEYYRGLLAADREPATGRLSKAECLVLREVANFAWRAANKGLLHLVQRRLGPDRFGYLAIARPRPKALALSSLLFVEDA